MSFQVLTNLLRPGSLARGFFVAAAFVLALAASPQDASAENLIKRPGAHNRYSFELEPQLVYRPSSPSGSWNGYNDYYGYNGNVDGIGPGLRVNIPFMHNGPIDEINNNIGISFGGSLTWHSWGNSYDAFVLNLPVAFQWNFYFTDIISVLGEVGLNTPLTFHGDYGGNQVDFDVEPLFQGGGRFQFGKVGVLVRIGWPMMSVGANIQF